MGSLAEKVVAFAVVATLEQHPQRLFHPVAIGRTRLKGTESLHDVRRGNRAPAGRGQRRYGLDQARDESSAVSVAGSSGINDLNIEHCPV